MRKQIGALFNKAVSGFAAFALAVSLVPAAALPAIALPEQSPGSSNNVEQTATVDSNSSSENPQPAEDAVDESAAVEGNSPSSSSSNPPSVVNETLPLQKGIEAAKDQGSADESSDSSKDDSNESNKDSQGQLEEETTGDQSVTDPSDSEEEKDAEKVEAINATLVLSDSSTPAGTVLSFDSLTYMTASDGSKEVAWIGFVDTPPTGALVIPSQVAVGTEFYDVTAIDVSPEAKHLAENALADDVSPAARAAAMQEAVASGVQAAGITSISIPSSVVSIEPAAFISYPNLTSFEVGVGSESLISERGLLLSADMTSLLAVAPGMTGRATIPATVTQVAPMAFAQAKSVASISVENADVTPSRQTTPVAAAASESNSAQNEGEAAFDYSAFASNSYVSACGLLYQVGSDGTLALVAAPGGIGQTITLAPGTSRLLEGSLWALPELASIVASSEVNDIALSERCLATAMDVADSDGEQGTPSGIVNAETRIANLWVGISALAEDCAPTVYGPWTDAWEKAGAVKGEGNPPAAKAQATLGDVHLELAGDGTGLAASLAPEAAERVPVHLAIPETAEIDGISYPVTSIAAGGFQNTVGLAIVDIPASVYDIGVAAFAGCADLLTVNLGSGVERIGARAFEGTVLLSLELPSSVAHVGAQALSGLDGTVIAAHPGVSGVEPTALAGATGVKVLCHVADASKWEAALGLPAQGNSISRYEARAAAPSVSIAVGDSAPALAEGSELVAEGPLDIEWSYRAQAISVDPDANDPARSEATPLRAGATQVCVRVVWELPVARPLVQTTMALSTNLGDGLKASMSDVTVAEVTGSPIETSSVVEGYYRTTHWTLTVNDQEYLGDVPGEADGGFVWPEENALVTVEGFDATGYLLEAKDENEDWALVDGVTSVEGGWNISGCTVPVVDGVMVLRAVASTIDVTIPDAQWVRGTVDDSARTFTATRMQTGLISVSEEAASGPWDVPMGYNSWEEAIGTVEDVPSYILNEHGHTAPVVVTTIEWEDQPIYAFMGAGWALSGELPGYGLSAHVRLVEQAYVDVELAPIMGNGPEADTFADTVVKVDEYDERGPMASYPANFNYAYKTEGKFTYYLNADNLTLTVTHSSTDIEPDNAETGELVVPATFDGRDVVSVRDYAFKSCSKIKILTFSEGIEMLYGRPAHSMSNLERINIPSTVRFISEDVGGDGRLGAGSPKLASYNVAPGNLWYSSDGGVLYNRSKSKLIFYPAASPFERYVMPDSIKKLATRCFWTVRGMKELVISDAITDLSGRCQFYDMGVLESVVVGASVTKWNSDQLFRYASSLKSLFIKGSLTQILGSHQCYNEATGKWQEIEGSWDGPSVNVYLLGDQSAEVQAAFKGSTKFTVVTNYGEGFFGFDSFDATSKTCRFTGLTSNAYGAGEGERKHVLVPGWYTKDGVTYQVKTAKDNTFNEADNILSVTFNSGLEAFEGYYSMKRCDLLEAIKLPRTLTTLSFDSSTDGRMGSFSYNLKEILVDPACKTFANDDAGLLYRKNAAGELATLCIYPPKAPGKRYVMPNSVTSVESRVFYSLRVVEDIVLSDNLMRFGGRCLVYDCTTLKSFTFGSATQYWSCGQKMSNCSAFTDIYVKGTMTSIMNTDEDPANPLKDDWSGPAKSKVTVHLLSDQSAAHQAVWKGFNLDVQYGSDIFNFGTPDETNKTISVTGLKDVNYGAGEGESPHIVVPGVYNGYAVTTAAENAFNSSKNIESITFSDGLVSLPQHVACDCPKLTTVYFPSTLTSMIFGGGSNGRFGRGSNALERFVVDPANEVFASDDAGLLYRKNTTTGALDTLCIYPAGNRQETYEMPDTIKMVEGRAFYPTTYLKHLILNDEVSNLKVNGDTSYTFNYCTIETITLGVAITDFCIPQMFRSGRLTTINVRGHVTSAPTGGNWEGPAKGTVTVNLLNELGEDLTDVGAHIQTWIDAGFTRINAQGARYVAHFDPLNGGSVPDQYVGYTSDGSFNWKLTEPAEPTREGYVFAGWYDSPSYSKRWNFAYDTVSEDNTTLYAKWTSDDCFYNIEHWTQNLNAASTEQNSTNYTLVSTIKEGATKNVASAAPFASIAGFTPLSQQQSVTVREGDVADGVSKITVKYYYTRDAFTLTYDAGTDGMIGDAQTKSVAGVKYEQKVTSPGTPVRLGFTFDYWYYLNGTKKVQWNFNTSQMPPSDLTLLAHWTAKQYTLQLAANGKTIVTNSAAPSGKYTMDGSSSTKSSYKAPSATQYTANGYNLLKWKVGSTELTPGTNYTMKQLLTYAGDSNLTVTLTAQWSAAIEYTITYAALPSGAAAPTTANKTKYTIETASFTLNNPSRTGYTAKGWKVTTGTAGGAGIATANNVTTVKKGTFGNFTLTAQFDENKYSIVYKCGHTDEGTWPDQTVSNVLYTAEVTVKNSDAFGRVGWRFNGWKRSDNGQVIAANAKVSKLVSTNGGTITLTAQWLANKYKVEFYDNLGKRVGLTNYDTTPVKSSTMPANASFTYGQAFNPSATPAREGYDFLGWAESADATAKKYNATGSSFTPGVARVGQADGAVTQKLYAVWQWKTTDVPGYQINFMLENADNEKYTKDGESFRNTSRKAGETLTENNVKEWWAAKYPGFTYEKLEIDAGATSVTSPKTFVIRGDKTTAINVYYTRNVHTVTVKTGETGIKASSESASWTHTASGATSATTSRGATLSSVKYGATVTITAVAADGYDFKEWGVTNVNVADKAQATTTFTMPNADVVATPSATPKDVNFVFNLYPMGSGISMKDDKGNLVNKLTVPFKWDATAQWVAPGQTGDWDEEGTNPIRQGYHFKGWSTSNNYKFQNDPAKDIPANGFYAVGAHTGNVALSGKYEPTVNFYPVWVNNEYTVTLNPNNGEIVGWQGESGHTGGVISQAEPYAFTRTYYGSLDADNYQQVFATFPTSSQMWREGYTFEGWVQSDDTSDNPPKTGSMATNSFPNDVTFMAQWKPITFDVTYGVGNTGTNGTGRRASTYDAAGAAAVFGSAAMVKQAHDGSSVTVTYTYRDGKRESNRASDTGESYSSATQVVPPVSALFERDAWSPKEWAGSAAAYGELTAAGALMKALFKASLAYNPKPGTSGSAGEGAALSATWTHDAYTITYVSKFNQPAVDTYYFDAPPDLPALSQDGYIFGGWTVTKTGTGDLKMTGGGTTSAKVNAGTWGTLTATAKWTPKKYKVAFDRNDASLPEAVRDGVTGEGPSNAPWTVEFDQTVRTPTLAVQGQSAGESTVTYSVPGFTLMGWSEDANYKYKVGDGAAQGFYALGSNFKNLWDDEGGAGNDANDGTVTKTLHAVWNEHTYSVKFGLDNADNEELGEEFAPADLSKVTYTQEISLPEGFPTKVGYEFKGWALDANKDGVADEGATVFTKGSAKKPTVHDLYPTDALGGNGVVWLAAAWEARDIRIAYGINDSEGAQVRNEWADFEGSATFGTTSTGRSAGDAYGRIVQTLTFNDTSKKLIPAASRLEDAGSAGELGPYVRTNWYASAYWNTKADGTGVKVMGGSGMEITAYKPVSTKNAADYWAEYEAANKDNRSINWRDLYYRIFMSGDVGSVDEGGTCFYADWEPAVRVEVPVAEVPLRFWVQYGRADDAAMPIKAATGIETQLYVRTEPCEAPEGVTGTTAEWLFSPEDAEEVLGRAQPALDEDFPAYVQYVKPDVQPDGWGGWIDNTEPVPIDDEAAKEFSIPLFKKWDEGSDGILVKTIRWDGLDEETEEARPGDETGGDPRVLVVDDEGDVYRTVLDGSLRLAFNNTKEGEDAVAWQDAWPAWEQRMKAIKGDSWSGSEATMPGLVRLVWTVKAVG